MLEEHGEDTSIISDVEHITIGNALHDRMAPNIDKGDGCFAPATEIEMVRCGHCIGAWCS